MSNKLVCCYGKGMASDYDKLCCFCREKLFSRRQTKLVGVRHRGDGMTIEQARKLGHRYKQLIKYAEHNFEYQAEQLQIIASKHPDKL